MSERQAPTAEFASFVYGSEGVLLDDPAEAFHEASRLYPNVAPGRLASLLALAASSELQQTSERSSRTHAHRSGVDLPVVALPSTSLRRAIAGRASSLPEHRRPVPLDELAALLVSAYGTRTRDPGLLRRPVPSGGALYPLELYVLPLAVPRLDASAFHYDPFRHRLERLRPLGDVAAALVDPAVASRAAAVIAITGMVWRARFKYGARGYRFALLEAGHVAQNMALAAAALGVGCLPLGGFFDRDVDRLVGADGLDETTLYLLAIGGRR